MNGCAKLVGLLVLLSGCGYHRLSGQRAFGVGTIAILPFVEDEPVGISPLLLQALAKQLGAGGTRITFDEERADAVLEGVIDSGRTVKSPLADPSAPVPAYQMVLDLHATLRDPNDCVLWQTRLRLDEDFLSDRLTEGVGDPVLGTETNRRRAMHRLAESAAERLYQTMQVDAAFDPQEKRCAPQEAAHASP